MEVLEVVPVTPDRWADIAELFASSESTRCCWCMWPRHLRGEFEPWAGGNRESMRDLSMSGATPGLVCLLDGRARGWCALGPTSAYPAYEESTESEAADWAIPCVYVAPEARAKGVADALITYAKVYAARRGAKVLHGPPQWWKAREETEQGAVTRLLRRHDFTLWRPEPESPCSTAR